MSHFSSLLHPADLVIILMNQCPLNYVIVSAGLTVTYACNVSCAVVDFA